MRILCLEGGGFKGALQVGVLEAIERSGVKIDLVLGTSVGALNGAIFATGQTSKLRSADLWGGVDGVGSFLSLNPFQGAGKGGIYSTRPMRDKIQKFIKGKASFGISYGCGIVVRETGDHLLYMHSTGDDADLQDAIVASASIAGVMVPVRAALEAPISSPVRTLSDGGHIYPLPLPQNVPGDPYKGVVTEIIAVLCNPLDVDACEVPTSKVDGLIDSAGWAADMALHQGHRWAIDRLQELAEDGVKVTVYAPPKSTGGLLDAKRATIAQRLLIGEEMAKNPIVLR
jgi:predicted acylesterase/phospholipase RssA